MDSGGAIIRPVPAAQHLRMYERWVQAIRQVCLRLGNMGDNCMARLLNRRISRSSGFILFNQERPRLYSQLDVAESDTFDHQYGVTSTGQFFQHTQQAQGNRLVAVNIFVEQQQAQTLHMHLGCPTGPKPHPPTRPHASPRTQTPSPPETRRPQRTPATPLARLSISRMSSEVEEEASESADVAQARFRNLATAPVA